jgi:hypothetical protein
VSPPPPPTHTHTHTHTPTHATRIYSRSRDLDRTAGTCGHDYSYAMAALQYTSTPVRHHADDCLCPHPYDEPTPEYWRLNNAVQPHAPPSIKERGELWP